MLAGILFSFSYFSFFFFFFLIASGWDKKGEKKYQSDREPEAHFGLFEGENLTATALSVGAVQAYSSAAPPVAFVHPLFFFRWLFDPENSL